MSHDYNFLKVTKMSSLKESMTEPCLHVLISMVNDISNHPVLNACYVTVLRSSLHRSLYLTLSSTTVHSMASSNLQIMTLKHGKFKLLVLRSPVCKDWVMGPTSPDFPPPSQCSEHLQFYTILNVMIKS